MRNETDQGAKVLQLLDDGARE